MAQLEAALAFIPYLHELNKDKGKNFEEFPVLNTDEKDGESWWNSLNEDGRHSGGCIAMHFYKMSANYRWSYKNYCDLSKSQKKIIKFVFLQKEKDYTMFYLPGLLKL